MRANTCEYARSEPNAQKGPSETRWEAKEMVGAAHSRDVVDRPVLGRGRSPEDDGNDGDEDGDKDKKEDDK